MEELVQEIHTSLEEQLQQRWGSAQLKEGAEQGPTSTLRSEHQVEFPRGQEWGAVTHAIMPSLKPGRCIAGTRGHLHAGGRD